jgi:hypothetical protein
VNIFFLEQKLYCMSWYQTASSEDVPKSGASLPSAKKIDYKGGKIQANMVARVAKDLDQMVHGGEAGFSYWNAEESRTVPVKKFEMIVLGAFWRVDTFTGGGAIKITSSPVLDIKRDVMQLYKAGEKWTSGLYSDLKEQFPTKETRAYRYLLLFSPTTKKLATIQLNNTVDNALRRSFFELENPGKEIQPKANLWSIDGDDRRFFVLLYTGVLTMLDADGKAHAGKGEGYIAPVFQIAKITPESADVFAEATEAKASYIGVLEQRLSGKRGQESTPAPAVSPTEKQDALKAAAEALAGIGFEPDLPETGEDDDLPF